MAAPVVPGRTRPQLGGLVDLVRRRPAAAAFVLALAVRAVVALVIFVRSGGTLFPDDARYDEMTTGWVEGTTEEWDDFTRLLFREMWAFSLPLTGAKLLFGTAAIVGQLTVAVVGALAAAATTRVARELVRPGFAFAAGAAVALFPSVVLWSSLMLKDAFVWLLCACLALLVVELTRARGRRRWLLAIAIVVALVLLDAVRFHTMVIAAWSLVAAGAVVDPRRRWPNVIGAAAIAVVLPAVLGHGLGGSDLVRARSLNEWRALNAIDAETAVVAPVVTHESATARSEAAAAAAAAADAQAAALLAEAEALDPPDAQVPPDPQAVAAAASLRAQAEEALQRAQAEAAAAAALDEAADQAIDTPVVDDGAGGAAPVEDGLASNVRYLPRGVAVMLLEPYPWHRSSNGELRLAQAEHLLWYPLLLLAAVGLFARWRALDVLAVPLLLAAGSILASALTQGNFGTAYRHRAEIVWIVCLLAAAGAAHLVERRRPRARADALDPVGVS